MRRAPRVLPASTSNERHIPLKRPVLTCEFGAFQWTGLFIETTNGVALRFCLDGDIGQAS